MIANQDNPTQEVKVRRKGKALLPGDGKRKQEREGKGLGEQTENMRLTRKERAVLHVVMDPDNADKSVVQLIELAGVCRQTYYNVMQNENVQAERRKMCKDLITSKVAPIIQRSIKVAMSEGRDGFQDRRLLLSMSGDYVERQQHDVNLTARVMVGVVGVSMDELG